MSDEPIKLSCCGQCGSPAHEDDPDWNGVVEYYGVSEQSVTISCSCENKEWCPISIDISLDSNIDFNGNEVEKIAAKAWNDLAELLKGN